jgi:hypothetical protein
MWGTRGYGVLLPLATVTLALLFAEVPARETGAQPVQKKGGVFSRLSRTLQSGINFSNILSSAPLASSVSSAVLEDDPEDKAADNQVGPCLIKLDIGCFSYSEDQASLKCR